MIAYAGIGSRSTPTHVEPVLAQHARGLASVGYVLRSGAAPGADATFERAALSVGGSVEIYLPWPGFNGHASPLCRPLPRAFEIAAAVHPAWSRCSDAARKLHARNAHQVLGRTLDEPVAFVLCWTPRGETVGGTATAIRIAELYGIPVVNLGASPTA